MPCFREGKVTRLHLWLQGLGRRFGDFAETWFYSDSANDLPLLELVSHPVVSAAEAHAASRGWPILRLHGAG